jgi:hypothetical protein
VDASVVPRARELGGREYESRRKGIQDFGSLQVVQCPVQGNVCVACALGEGKRVARGRNGFASRLAGWAIHSRRVVVVLGRRSGLRLTERVATAPGSTGEISLGPSASRLLPGLIICVRVCLSILSKREGAILAQHSTTLLPFLNPPREEKGGRCD